MSVRSINKLSFFYIVIFIFLSCTVKKATINKYIDPTYTNGIVQKITVFPVIYTQIESYEAEIVNGKIIKELQNKNPTLELVRPNAAKKLLEKNNLADDWALFRENYLKYGRPDFKILSLIRSKLKTDAIMQGEIIDVIQKDGQYQLNTAKTIVTVKYCIFDLRRGKLIWEVSSNGLTEIELTFEKAPPIIDVINLAIEGIIESLPVL